MNSNEQNRIPDFLGKTVEDAEQFNEIMHFSMTYKAAKKELKDLQLANENFWNEDKVKKDYHEFYEIQSSNSFTYKQMQDLYPVLVHNVKLIEEHSISFNGNRDQLLNKIHASLKDALKCVGQYFGKQLAAELTQGNDFHKALEKAYLDANNFRKAHLDGVAIKNEIYVNNDGSISGKITIDPVHITTQCFCKALKISTTDLEQLYEKFVVDNDIEDYLSPG